MITKAEIKSIDQIKNTCKLDIGIFQGKGNISESEAYFSIPPGHYNNYVVGDIVFIAFEENQINTPIVIGKLYQGITKEQTIDRAGSSIVDSLTVTSNASLPGSTTFLTTNGIVTEGGTEISTNDIVSSIKNLQQQIVILENRIKELEK